MSRRWATTGMFFVNGAVIGTWVAQIPWTQERFDLSKSALGIVLVAMSIAVIVASPIAGQLIVKHGSRRMTLAGGIAAALAVNLVVLAPHPLVLAPCLLVLGACNATMDMSMNAHGVDVEQELGRPIMSSLHAGWSFGGVAGAGLAAALVALGAHPRVTVAIASLLLLGLVLYFNTRLGEGSAAEGEETPRFSLPSRGVMLLAILCLLTMVTEGAMGDWGGIYLRGDLGASAAIAAVTFSVFSAGMTTGRIVGDWVTGRLGPVRTLQAGALLTGVSLGAALLIGMPIAALIGLFAVGLGVANGVPLMFSAAGRQPGTAAGPAIAAVSSMGSFGFLIGPPIIGVLADAVSLPWALTTLILAAAVVFALARRAAGEPEAPRPRPSRRSSPTSTACWSTPAPRPCAAGPRGAIATGSTAPRSRPATTAGPRARSWPSTCRPTTSTPTPTSSPTPRRPTPRASSRCPARPTCSRCRRWRSPPRARRRWRAPAWPRPGCRSPRCSSPPTRWRTASPPPTRTCWPPSGWASTRPRASCSRTRRPASSPGARRA